MLSKKFFIILEEILVISIFQYFFISVFKFKIIPSFYLIYLLLLSFRKETEVALFLCFILGLFNDLLTNEILGITSIRFLLIVYFSSFFVVKSIKSKGILIFIFSFLYFVLIAFGKVNESFWEGKIILKYSVLFSMYNFISSVIIETLMNQNRKKWIGRYS